MAAGDPLRTSTDEASDPAVAINTNTWPIWVIAVLPLLSAANGLVPLPTPDLAPVPEVLAVLSVALSVAIFIAVIVLARLDHHILRQRGVTQPMPWGWGLLETVYVIGRSVVVRRRAHGSLAPLWAWIGSTIVYLAAVLVP